MDSSIGDMAALAQLVERYREQLLTMVRRRIDPRLAARIDAEDVLNNAFLAARRKYAMYAQHPEIDGYPWLYRIVLDALIEAWRRETRDQRDAKRTMHWPSESSVRFESVLADDATSPSGAVDRKIRQQQVQELLERLASKDQEILWMRHFDQLTHREAGAVLEITESAATLRYVRALRRLKQIWNSTHGDSEQP